ncbi:hypothetical protein [Actinacidiphila sp. ITFR-21]|uniref:hypothetical protein n=1 Tax=Actinacidiphila sp. ITFR-21 TaxID=3075199 RepID=UPI00288BD0C3|nr:hypothetical protein [Streptomyces sp. ITFR-21]WNI17654.1 hypothetical protein RLT57_20405 [Streptomyces sp. ITFR-21]WNI17794.1 hypothetical protein RLT57_21120 [Streptomyces sp. ITFR-21]
MSDDLSLPIPQAVELLRGLMEVLYLSPACASGNHSRCDQVDRFRSLVCCCPECEHADLAAGLPAGADVPLLHLAATEAEQRASHVYAPGEQLGIRQDLHRSLTKTLEERTRLSETNRLDLAVQLGISAVLVFAPRAL